MTAPSDRRDAARIDLTKGPIGKTLFRLAWPMFFGMLAMSFFNITDTFFVAQLGTQELAAMSFTFPVVMLIGSLTLGLGIGVTSTIAPRAGAGDHEEVRRLARDGLMLAVLIVAVVSVAGFLSIGPLFRALGAEGHVLDLVEEYMLIWFGGTVFVVVPMVGNSAIRGTGDTRTPAAIMTVAALANLVLDPLFIFGLGPVPAMGIRGAAIATVIGRATTLVLALHVLIWRRKLVEAALPSLRGLLQRWRHILSVGVPAALANTLVPISMGMLTGIIAGHGPGAVAAFGAGTRVEMFAFMIPAALGSGIVPFIGHNWGAGQVDRVRQVITLSQRFLLVQGTALWLALFVLAEPIAGLFSDEARVLDPLVTFLHLATATLMFDAVTGTAVSILNGLQQSVRAMVLNATRLLVFLVPLTYAGSALYGIAGAFSGMAVARACAGVVAYLVLRHSAARIVQPARRSPVGESPPITVADPSDS